MPSSIAVSEQSTEFTGYLKEHFDGVAACLFNEPFSYEEWDTNGFTVVLNREPTEEESANMCDVFNGIPVRWDTPSIKHETPKKKVRVMTIDMKPTGK